MVDCPAKLRDLGDTGRLCLSEAVQLWPCLEIFLGVISKVLLRGALQILLWSKLRATNLTFH